MSYSIGQIAKKYDLTISQIRYYDKQGLFPFLTRSEKGDRSFDEKYLLFLEVILCLKDTGMPLKEIKQFVDQSMAGSSTIPQRLEMMHLHEQKVVAQLKETEHHLQKIREKIERLRKESTSHTRQ